MSIIYTQHVFLSPWTAAAIPFIFALMLTLIVICTLNNITEDMSFEKLIRKDIGEMYIHAHHVNSTYVHLYIHSQKAN